MGMGDLEATLFARRNRLLAAMGQLMHATTIDAFVETLRSSARGIAAAEGVTVVRREGALVAYLAEDAISPLWAGRRFPIDACISGVAITDNAPVRIDDIYADARVPHSAYRPTFVRSMAMFPLGSPEPRMALGAYWRARGPIDNGTIGLLTSLARSAGMALDRIAPALAAA